MVRVTVLRSCLKKHVAELSCCQVWGISETRDQNYHSNVRPRLRLADLLTEVVILQLRRSSERLKFDYCVYHFGPFPLIRLVFFRMHLDQGVRS